MTDWDRRAAAPSHLSPPTFKPIKSQVHAPFSLKNLFLPPPLLYIGIVKKCLSDKIPPTERDLELIGSHDSRAGIGVPPDRPWEISLPRYWGKIFYGHFPPPWVIILLLLQQLPLNPPTPGKRRPLRRAHTGWWGHFRLSKTRIPRWKHQFYDKSQIQYIFRTLPLSFYFYV